MRCPRRTSSWLDGLQHILFAAAGISEHSSGTHGSPAYSRGPARGQNKRQPSYFSDCFNGLARNFAAQKPNQVRLADLTCISIGEGWLYLAAILDGCTRKIVDWT